MKRLRLVAVLLVAGCGSTVKPTAPAAVVKPSLAPLMPYADSGPLVCDDLHSPISVAVASLNRAIAPGASKAATEQALSDLQGDDALLTKVDTSAYPGLAQHVQALSGDFADFTTGGDDSAAYVSLAYDLSFLHSFCTGHGSAPQVFPSAAATP